MYVVLDINSYNGYNAWRVPIRCLADRLRLKEKKSSVLLRKEIINKVVDLLQQQKRVWLPKSLPKRSTRFLSWTSSSASHESQVGEEVEFQVAVLKRGTVS